MKLTNIKFRKALIVLLKIFKYNKIIFQEFFIKNSYEIFEKIIDNYFKVIFKLLILKKPIIYDL